MVALTGLFVMLSIAAVLAWPLRRTTLWPLALPIALAFGEAGFVQTWDMQVEVPYFPFTLRWPDIVFGALVIAWLLVRRLSPPQGGSRWAIGVDEGVVIAWLVMAAVAILLSWIDEGRIMPWITRDVLYYCYVPLGLVILQSVFRRTGREAVFVLLRSLSVVVSALSIVYILHMSGWSLYDRAGVQSSYSALGEVRRDSLTFPVWACVTLPFLLWSERIGIVESVMILLQSAALAASLTRSFVLAGVLAVLLVAVLRVVNRRRPTTLLVPIGFGIAFVGGLSWWAPESLRQSGRLLMSRFDELSRGVASVPNVVERLAVGERVSSFLRGWTLLMGAGFSEAARRQTDLNLGHLLVYDSLWSLVLLTFGIVGAVVVAATLLIGLLQGVSVAFRQRREPLSLAAVGAAALLWLIARTPASSEILSFYPMVCAFAFALVTVEAHSAWSASREVRPLLPDRREADMMLAHLPQGSAFRAMLAVLALTALVLIGRVVAG